MDPQLLVTSGIAELQVLIGILGVAAVTFMGWLFLSRNADMDKDDEDNDE